MAIKVTYRTESGLVIERGPNGVTLDPDWDPGILIPWADVPDVVELLRKMLAENERS